MLGGVVVEGEQDVELAGHLGDRLGPVGEPVGEAGRRVERLAPGGRGAEGILMLSP